MMNGPHCIDMVSHPRDVARFVVECAEARIGVALVFVTAVEGGSMREPGLRMAASITGATAGYVSNGCVEADLVAQARKAIVENRPAAASKIHSHTPAWHHMLKRRCTVFHRP